VPRGVDRNCTTTRQNAHGTEVVVCYPWHPWYELPVRLFRSMTKRQEAILHVTTEQDKHTQLREVPAWMADPAACASMGLAGQPTVDCEALRSLQELLRWIDARHNEYVIEDQHLSSRLKGDADAVDLSSPTPSSAQDVSAPVIGASVAGAAGGSEAASSGTAGSASEGASHRTPRACRPRGGVG